MDSYLIEENLKTSGDRNHHTLSLKDIAQLNNEQIFNIITQKQQIIQIFSQQITKFKAEEIKFKKIISSLQQKIQKTFSSDKNTSTNFIIASEFKALLTTFMTNTVPSIFYDFVDNPQLYVILIQTIMQEVYNKIYDFFQGKLSQIANLLRFGQNKAQYLQQSAINQEQLRICLLNYFQNYFKKILPTIFQNFRGFGQQSQIEKQFNNPLISIKIKSNEIDSEIIRNLENFNSFQCQNSQEMKQFCQELYQICIYMILQENPWQFVFSEIQDTQKKQQKATFSKKQFTCIDGFAKQGKQVLYALKGLRKRQKSEKRYYYHPNIKNFVIPVVEDSFQAKDMDLQVRINFLRQQNQRNDLIEKSFQKNEFKQSSLDKSMQTDDRQIFIDIKSQISIKPKITEIHQENFLVNMNSYTNQNSNLSNKQNLSNINCINQNTLPIKLKHTQSHTKKEKHFIQEKPLANKSKKQKINSTINLVTQIRKNSQKDHNNHREIFDDLTHNYNCMKNYELPLSFSKTYGKSTHKKKKSFTNNNNKLSNRKCSVGKIVSQSIHINGDMKHTNKEKNSLSQHSTILMKQSCKIIKPSIIIKDNFVIGSSDQLNDENNKQNICHFASHVYQKPLQKPKRTTKVNVKNENKILKEVEQSYNNHNESKQERPLMIKQRKDKSHLNIGKLRQKYLVN